MCIDPGQHTGLALFAGDRLVSAWCLTADIDPRAMPACPLCRGVCSHLVTDAAELVQQLRAAVNLQALDLAAIERPAYWKGDTPNLPAILKLAELAGALAGALLAEGKPVLAYQPRQWKGETPKDRHQAETLATLDEAERAHIPRSVKTRRYQSDVTDAAGLGLFILRRAGRWQADPAIFAGLVEPRRFRAQRIGAGRRRSGAQSGFAFGPKGAK